MAGAKDYEPGRPKMVKITTEGKTPDPILEDLSGKTAVGAFLKNVEGALLELGLTQKKNREPQHVVCLFMLGNGDAIVAGRFGGKENNYKAGGKPLPGTAFVQLMEGSHVVCKVVNGQYICVPGQHP